MNKPYSIVIKRARRLNLAYPCDLDAVLNARGLDVKFTDPNDGDLFAAYIDKTILINSTLTSKEDGLGRYLIAYMMYASFFGVQVVLSKTKKPIDHEDHIDFAMHLLFPFDEETVKMVSSDEFLKDLTVYNPLYLRQAININKLT